MASNPMVPQGQLNRLIASVTIPNFAGLNVTAPFLGSQGVSLSFDGDGVLFIEAMTGTVISPQPYVMVTAMMHLLKSQSLAAQYELQRQTQSAIGSFTVRPDVSSSVGLGPWTISNGAIQTVRELNFSGTDAGYVVTLRGAYFINNDLWNLT